MNLKFKLKKVLSLLTVLAVLASGLITGVQAAGLDPYTKFPAFKVDDIFYGQRGDSNVKKGPERLDGLYTGMWVCYKGLDFGENGPTMIEIETATPASYIQDVLEIRLDSLNGPTIALVPLTPSSDWGICVTNTAPILKKITGVHDIYVAPLKSALNLGNIVFYENVRLFSYDRYENSSGFSDVEDDGLNKTLKLLTQLGIVEIPEYGLYNPDIPATRAEFAQSVYRLFVEPPIDEEEEKDECHTRFEDVAADSEYAEAIKYLSESGIINGVNNTEFRPDSFITNCDAVTVLVRALGFKELADVSGGYPNGYIRTAVKEKLIPSYDISNDEYMSRENMAYFLESAIKANYLDMDSFTADGYVNYIKKDGILNLTRRINGGSGKIMATPMTRLLMSGSDLKFDEIVIDDEVYCVGETPAITMLGMEVDYWYTEVDGRKTLCSILPQDSTEITEISSAVDNLEKLSNSEIVYTRAGATKQEKVDISDAPVFYNGVAADDTLEDIVDNENNFKGFISIIENSDNSLVVSIDEYIDVEVESIDFEKNEIRARMLARELSSVPASDDIYIDVSKNNFVIMEDSSGARTTIDTVVPGDILTVYMSKNSDKKLVRVFKSADTITGTIDKKDAQGNLYIDGKKYIFSNRYDGIEDLGAHGTFYLNIYGEVVKSEKLKGNAQVGLFFGTVKKSDGFNTAVDIKIMKTDAKTEIYKLSDRIIVDGIRKNTAEEALSTVEVLSKESPIRYKLNAEGEVIMIDTPGEVTDDENDTLIELQAPGDKFYYESNDSYIVGITNKIYHSKFYCLPTATAFGFKSEYIADEAGSKTRETTCVAGSVRNVLVRGWTADGGAYSTTGDNKVADLVVDRDILDAVRYNYRTRVVFDSLTTDLDENGEVIDILKVFSNGKDVTYTLTEVFMDADYMTGITNKEVIKGLKKGDVINIITASASDMEILEIETVFYSAGEQFRTINDINIGSIISHARRTTAHSTQLKGVYLYGKVSARSDSYMIVNVLDGTTTFEDLVTLGSAKVIEVYKRGDEVLINPSVKANEIEKGDTVMVYFNVDGKPELVVIYANGDESAGGAEL